MRKYVVALIALITFGVAMGATIFNRTVAEALVRAEGYTYPVPPSEPAPTYTAASEHAGDRR
jgi:hypothetical protein